MKQISDKNKKCSTEELNEKINRALKKLQEATKLIQEEKEEEENVISRQQHKVSEARG